MIGQLVVHTDAAGIDVSSNPPAYGEGKHCDACMHTV